MDTAPPASGERVSTGCRVAHVVLTLNVGGLERLICVMARHRDPGDELLVVCLDEPGSLASELEALGIRTILVPRRPGLDPGLVFRIAAALRREQVRVLHTHSLDPMVYAGLAACLAGVRVRIHTQHNTMLGAY